MRNAKASLNGQPLKDRSDAGTHQSVTVSVVTTIPVVVSPCFALDTTSWVVNCNGSPRKYSGCPSNLPPQQNKTNEKKSTKNQ